MGIQTQIDRIKGEVETQTAQIGTNAALIEQIKAALDGKAAGGGGGASVETGILSVVDNGMDRPGVYKYVLHSDGLQGSQRLVIILIANVQRTSEVIGVLRRNNNDEAFSFMRGAVASDIYQLQVSPVPTVNGNDITAYGYLSSTYDYTFIAF